MTQHGSSCLLNDQSNPTASYSKVTEICPDLQPHRLGRLVTLQADGFVEIQAQCRSRSTSPFERGVCMEKRRQWERHLIINVALSSFFFLSSPPPSTPSFILSLLLAFAHGFILPLAALPWPWLALLARLAVRSSSAVLVIQARILTFTENASKAATISISYKPSYSTPVL